MNQRDSKKKSLKHRESSSATILEGILRSLAALALFLLSQLSGGLSRAARAWAHPLSGVGAQTAGRRVVLVRLMIRLIDARRLARSRRARIPRRRGIALGRLLLLRLLVIEVLRRATDRHGRHTGISGSSVEAAVVEATIVEAAAVEATAVQATAVVEATKAAHRLQTERLTVRRQVGLFLLGALDLAAGLSGSAGAGAQSALRGVGAHAVGRGVVLVGLVVGLVDAAGAALALGAGVTGGRGVALGLALFLERSLAKGLARAAERDEGCATAEVGAAGVEAAIVEAAAGVEATIVEAAAGVEAAVVEAAETAVQALVLTLALMLVLCATEKTLNGSFSTCSLIITVFKKYFLLSKPLQ